MLAERAQLTKQAMAELMRHLEIHGYVVRVPDPGDRRAKLEVVAIAQQLVPELDDRLGGLLGPDGVQAQRADLDAIRRPGPERQAGTGTLEIV